MLPPYQSNLMKLAMNKDELKGKRKQLKGKAKEK